MGAVLLSACATGPTEPDTPQQTRARADVEACRQRVGGGIRDVTVTPEGRYRWRSVSTIDNEAMLSYMRDRGYAPQRRR